MIPRQEAKKLMQKMKVEPLTQNQYNAIYKLFELFYVETKPMERVLMFREIINWLNTHTEKEGK